MTTKNKIRKVSDVSVNHSANASTKPSVSLVDIQLTTDLNNMANEQTALIIAVNTFGSMLADYTNTGMSRRSQLQALIIHTVWFNYKFHKVQLIQKLLGSLVKDTETPEAVINRVIFFYQNVAGFKIHRVGNDFQIKRLNTSEFTYDAENLTRCKLDANSYWNLAQGQADKPYKAKELDTIKKSIAIQLATSLLLEEATMEDIDALIASLKSAIVTAKADFKIISKAEKLLALKHAEPEAYQAD